MVSREKHVSLQENNNMLGISSVLYVYVTVVTKISRTDKVILLITTIQLVQGKKKKKNEDKFLSRGENKMKKLMSQDQHREIIYQLSQWAKKS